MDWLGDQRDSAAAPCPSSWAVTSSSWYAQYFDRMLSTCGTGIIVSGALCASTIQWRANKEPLVITETVRQMSDREQRESTRERIREWVWEIFVLSSFDLIITTSTSDKECEWENQRERESLTVLIINIIFIIFLLAVSTETVRQKRPGKHSHISSDSSTGNLRSISGRDWDHSERESYCSDYSFLETTHSLKRQKLSMSVSIYLHTERMLIMSTYMLIVSIYLHAEYEDIPTCWLWGPTCWVWRYTYVLSMCWV